MTQANTTAQNPADIRVVAAIIWNQDRSQILLSRRKSTQEFAGLWEFPGGKVEQDEADQVAMIRELEEELAIEVTELSLALQFRYDYPHKSIDFIIYDITQFTGEPIGAEFQEVAWFSKEELSSLPFPEANQRMIEYILTSP
ncbi:8-oxo-dGTP diphosphatase MutT [Ignatzschineria ureiclastica]|uniref:8-oxo-dGTP diphosphatase n=1 Tax=Ignatzschineria ureiclastica TaxID=472582 RepID=A0A2U2AFY6_9GAMM|nr:8-oxo-dGTP diphosphatase MutT [Ignatzschineria ureiclastica]PWD81489.1 8-oxo-dGTP diphosphatase MutT [Ignatzschineria ureiclastica]GHA01048.1 7,8-dihydro-8-oxoguanine-triphosphatase [Ignatzschineria ureiclastica]